MESNEVAARLIVLETFAMTALGMFLANAGNDPDFSKATALIEHLKQASVANAAAASPQVQALAKGYSDHLSSILAENLRGLRGSPGRPH